MENQVKSVICISNYFKGNDFIINLKKLGNKVYLITSETLKNEAWAFDCIDEVFYMPGFDLEEVGHLKYGRRLHIWDFKKKEFIKPTELEANRWLYTQVLTGDAVDGYKGCPRIGKVKAERALMDCENELELLRETFVRYYVAYKNSIDDAKENLLAQMGQARILNYPDLITLKNFDKTFNPIEIMSVSDEVLQEWADEYTEKISKEKKCKNSSAKNVPKSVKS